MAEAPVSPGGGSHESGDQSPRSNVREQDRYLPIANISRIMKKALPANGKIAKDAKETVQECVSEFISFITSEASDKCQREKRKTINGDDLLWAMATLGFEDYIEPLKIYLGRYREVILSQRWRVTPKGHQRAERHLLKKMFNQAQMHRLLIKHLSHKELAIQILKFRDRSEGAFRSLVQSFDLRKVLIPSKMWRVRDMTLFLCVTSEPSFIVTGPTYDGSYARNGVAMLFSDQRSFNLSLDEILFQVRNKFLLSYLSDVDTDIWGGFGADVSIYIVVSGSKVCILGSQLESYGYLKKVL
ncbi:hypothetical protein FEM48_Zijuj12G0151900 [Ziziphus jujuba var. spinosa]|uniref:Transcription factor CBF/NF-Y/archaeal histone domain-containing protein n=1 Tax=Ziziphus jujuba var. spinosa TaxID=714518 RepID=A0A978UE25_ZIZJJ|nr:hypothetical protein FEM48_Zijuj12G0151900 [Ziziphus jujuba var. spinosa]